MDSPAQILRALTALGLTEKAIAERLARQDVAVSQATINRIKLGRIQRPSYEVGAALVRLRDELLDESTGQRRRA